MMDVMDMSGNSSSDAFSSGAMEEFAALDEELVRGRIGSDDGSPKAAESVDPAVAEELRSEAVAAGLQEADSIPAAAPATNAATSSSIASAAPPPPPQALGDAVDLEDLVGPYPSGRVYFRDIKSVASIIRGKPKNALSVRCGYHQKCTFLLPLRLAPSDDDLKRWLLAVPPNLPSDTEAQRLAKTQRHLALAKAWRDVPVAASSAAPTPHGSVEPARPAAQ